MHAANGPAWSLAIEHSAVGEAMRGGIYLYPAVETAHILGLATLVGSILVLDLRLLGLGRAIRAAALARLAIPVAATGLLIAVVTGAALFATEASAYIRNPAFLIKQSLILAGLVNIAAFHWLLKPAMAHWPEGPVPAAARLSAAISACVWLAVPAFGRLIAYI